MTIYKSPFTFSITLVASIAKFPILHQSKTCPSSTRTTLLSCGCDERCCAQQTGMHILDCESTPCLSTQWEEDILYMYVRLSLPPCYLRSAQLDPLATPE